jgi:uncharacterized protein (DUF58 family)
VTRRGRVVLALGLATYVAARLLGSKPLYPVAVGLVLSVLAARLSVRLARAPVQLWRELEAGEHFEGEDVRVVLRLERARRLAPGSITLAERIDKLGARETPLRRDAGSFAGEYVLRQLGRGRYAFGEAAAVLGDAFGLYRATVPLEAGSTLLVYPRLVALEHLFSDSGTHAPDGRRLLLRRPSGFDLHSVREYEQGESLRKVHWPSTAKRGALMVKELEDAPRDEIAVVLDAFAPAVVGESFEMQVRAAGSLLQAQSARGRRSVLVVNAAQQALQRVHSHAGDWRQAFDLLAAVEPTGTTPVAATVGDEAGHAARALELMLVTAAVTPELTDRLVQRTALQRRAALVYVEAASFGDRAAPRVPDANLLRLQAAGVAVTVLRRGDDLAERLAGARVGAVVG